MLLSARRQCLRRFLPHTRPFATHSSYNKKIWSQVYSEWLCLIFCHSHSKYRSDAVFKKAMMYVSIPFQHEQYRMSHDLTVQLIGAAPHANRMRVI